LRFGASCARLTAGRARLERDLLGLAEQLAEAGVVRRERERVSEDVRGAFRFPVGEV
jgi:hypothetical protein